MTVKMLSEIDFYDVVAGWDWNIKTLDVHVCPDPFSHNPYTCSSPITWAELVYAEDSDIWGHTPSFCLRWTLARSSGFSCAQVTTRNLLDLCHKRGIFVPGDFFPEHRARYSRRSLSD
ncbi:MAG: hypothetical protein V1792_07795 [Pseudomonadota bacterium]